MSSLKLAVAQLPQWLPEHWAEPNTAAIVIDTLRFTSTACVALHAGAASISVTSHIETARQLATASDPPKLLCGERLCRKIPGFDLGNSPLEYAPSVVGGRQLIFSTTNGTVAVEAAGPAQFMALGSLLNRAAVARWVASVASSNLWILCAGTDGQVAAEDVLTAGAIIHSLASFHSIDIINDSAWLARDAWQNTQTEQNLQTRLRQARGGRNLIETGFAADVEFVGQVDLLDCVPVRAAGQTSFVRHSY